MKLLLSQPIKRMLLIAAALSPLTVKGVGPADGFDAFGADSKDRFRGIGLVLVVDAVPGAVMEGVKFYNDLGYEIYGKSFQDKNNRSILSLGGARVPSTVRIIWRENPKAVRGKRGIDYEGHIIGDYLITVADRIPDEVVADIRARGGALRLKFRLKPDGVLLGWDIERPGGGISKFDLPGGDFLDTRY